MTRSSRLLMIGAAVLWSSQRPVAALPAGELDPTFGTAGRVESVNCLGTALAVQSDGKIVVAGHDLVTFTTACLARRLLDGSLDPSFGTGGVTVIPNSPTIFDLKVDSTDALLVGGGAASIYLSRVLANGTLDGSFGSGGTLTIAPVGGAYTLQPDDRIITADAVPLTDVVTIRRYHPDGSPDGTFGTAGVVTLSGTGLAGPLTGASELTAAAVRDDGVIVVATGNGLAQLDSTGVLDSGFGTGGIVLHSPGSLNQVLIQSDHKILVTGGGIRRFNTDGTPDVGFGFSGAVPGEGARLQADGKIVATLFSGQYGVKRFLPNGMVDATFGENGLATVPFPLVPFFGDLLPDGRIVVGGFPGRLVAIYGGTCGDGNLDLGEDCDDGNLTTGDGCDAACCTADADGDGLCDSYDPCDGTVAVTNGLLNVKPRRVDVTSAQHFVAKIQATLPSPVVPVLDPPASGMRLHLRNSARRVADAMILPGPGWTGTGPRWRWEGSAFPGVERVTVTTKPSVPGLVKVKVRGRAPLHARGILDAFPPSFEVAFDAVSAADGQCVAATFPGPSPAPSCTAKGTFGVTCK